MSFVPQRPSGSATLSAPSLKSEKALRWLVDAVRDYAIFMLTPEGNIATWNGGAQRLKGYEPKEIIGRHFSVFYPESDKQAGKPEMELREAGKVGRFEDEGWRIRKDGSRFWANVLITAIFDESGELIGFGKITRDLTERKILLDTISQHARQLELRVAEREAAYSEMEAFAYSVSHDLKAPLRAVEGFSQALAEEYSHVLDATAREYLAFVNNGAARMTRLIDDLLQYSRLGRAELPLQPVEARHAVEEAVAQLPAESRSGCDIENQVDPGITVQAHPQTLVQMLLNLLQNALKFRREEVRPRILIRAEHRGPMARILVEDNGIGIAPQHQQRIFNVFERLNDVSEFPGTGIGLAIIRRAVARMGGACGVESEPGMGSTFWIDLPVAASEGSLNE